MFLELLGGLGIFLFGLRIMSAGLQKVAGHRLRAILSGLTRNRFAGIFSGFAITCAVQSSSATTVMVVSFANAGLLTFIQSMGLVMGANIGTTITAWLVSLLGFKLNIAAFALPIIGIGFPLSFLGNRNRQISEVLVGFGLLFMGLKYLKDSVPDLRSNPEALDFVQSFTEFGFGSILIFVLVGTALTVIVQSSSAATAITITMASKGWIDFELAAAMVLGENIGTTITATLASLGANRTAVRVARFHTLFNLIGIFWVLPCFWFVLPMIDGIIPGDPSTDSGATPTHLAAFHTAFNLTNTFVLMWFLKPLERIVYKLVPLRERESEQSTLKFLETEILSTAELATVEVRAGLRKMVGVCDDMFGMIKKVVTNPTAKLGSVIDDIKIGEERTDRMEEEIVSFCAKIARSGLSAEAGVNVASYLDMANDIERMGDHCMNLALLAQRRHEKKYEFSGPAEELMSDMLDLVGEIIQTSERIFAEGDEHGTIEEQGARARILEEKTNAHRDRSRKLMATRMQDGEVSVREGLVFLDMMNNMEKLSDYAFNIVTVVVEEQDGSGSV